MRQLIIAFPMALAFALSGCGAQRMEVERQSWPGATALVPVATNSGTLEELREDVKTSSNQTQNSITGLGLNVGKIAETVQGFGGDLARLDLNLKASLTANTELRAEVKSLAQAQVGLRNELEQLSQTARAGRDAVQTTTQYSREMAATIVNLAWGTVIVAVLLTVIPAAVVVVFIERSRRRAQARLQKRGLE